MPRRGPAGHPTYDVCVVGLGYVGLPTACALANAGLKTVGVDSRSDIVEQVNRGISPVRERDLVDSVRRLHRTGRLSADTDLGEAVGASEATIIAVQTPLEGGKCNLRYLETACQQVAQAMKKGATVIVESTVPPGTCSRSLLPIFKRRGMVDGSGLLFAYCPERIAPGNSLQEFKNNDRIVGTENAASRRSAFKLLKKAIKGRIHFTDIQTAETTKLVENAARDVYIAFANDLAKIGTKIGVDSMEVIRLANTHPRVKILNPGPGVGGPCLTKDPYLLLEGMPPGESGAGTMVRTARAVNDSMKDEILALVDAKKLPNGSKVAVLGTSYKPDIDDPRGSPSEPIIAGLLKRGLDVFVADPHCSESFGAHRSPGIREAINGASCVLFLVAHSEFKGLDAGKLARLTGPSPVFIDAVGVLRKGSDHTRSYALLRLGDGRGPGPRD